MKKKLLIVLLLVFSLFLFVGCESTVDDTQIQTDLQSYTRSNLFDEDEEIKSLEITDRVTEKDNNLDVVYCTVTTMDANCSYEKDFVLTYTYDKNNGWVLDYVSVNDSDEWTICPLAGVAEDEISASLNGEVIYANGEVWLISKNNISSIDIDKHNTDLKGKTDTVTVTLTIDDIVEEATGALVLNYIFDEEWELESISGNDTFTAQTKSGMELNVTEEALIAVLAEETIEYGAPKEGVYSTSQLQTISINKDEISDFVIENYESLDKGTEQRFTCSCTLTKNNAEFTIDAIISYYYISSEGWVLQPIPITAECISVNIEGEWSGTYTGAPYSGTAVLTITSIEEDGTISGIYSYTPEVISKYSEHGSYEVSGKIDFTTMLVGLTAGDWIEKPTSPLSIEKQNISARLVVEESYIEGIGQCAYPFKVTKDAATQ